MSRAPLEMAETLPPTVADIHAAIRQDIVVLRLRPGERMSENGLAARFGLSRTPVREALFRLVDEGLVAVQPQRGTFVTRISMRAVRRARFVREAMEVAILRTAASQGLTADRMRLLESAIAAQEAARDDAEGFMAADDAFHRALAGSIDADVWDVVEREKAQLDRLRFLALGAATPVEILIAQHRAMLAAVRAADVAAAEAAVRTHLTEVLKVADGLAARHPGLIINDA